MPIRSITRKRAKTVSLQGYRTKITKKVNFDEMFNVKGEPRLTYKELFRLIGGKSSTPVIELQERVKATIETLGITFAVIDAEQGIDRAWPLDVLPRVVDETTWQKTTKGLNQRLRALNIFIQDCYGKQRALRAGIIPRELILGSPHYIAQCKGARPAHGAWVNICGTDLIRNTDGNFCVLEDNLRVPSGIAYMLENREVMYRVALELFESCRILAVERFPRQLYAILASLTPRPGSEPTIVVYTPGIYNSAYFEHVYLARQMGVPLVEASDMVVIDNVVYLRTISGLVQVDVIYRRIDDHFIDPKVLRKDSALGVPGLFRAWYRGKVSIANSPGTGIADDKSVYPYVPDLIRFYMDEEPLLPSLPTLHMHDKESRNHAFSQPEGFVFKPTSESGGKGIVIGRAASKQELKRLKRQIMANPRNFVAQELCLFSTAPTLVGKSIEPCHVDLRPFVLQGDTNAVTAGGLTRVASKPGELVVNSSQGGGSKDTWIVGKMSRSSRA